MSAGSGARSGINNVSVKAGQAHSTCTLGFNFYYSNKYHFVTASHCSDDWYTSTGDADAFRQPVAGHQIGVEVLDSGFWYGTRLGHTCYGARGCRLSDSDLVLYDDSVSVAHGEIARPMSPGYGAPGSLTIQTSNPTWDIEEPQPAAYLPVGMWLNKVGRTSGWTRGQVTKTCWTYNGTGSYGDFLCTFTTDIWSEDGDSGSPIFRENNSRNSSSQSWVLLAGILYGGPNGVWTETWFGTLSGVTADLGIGSGLFCVFWTPFNVPYGC